MGNNQISSKKHNDVNPVWNEDFSTFSIPVLDNMVLTLRVLNSMKTSSQEMINAENARLIKLEHEEISRSTKRIEKTIDIGIESSLAQVRSGMIAQWNYE